MKAERPVRQIDGSWDKFDDYVIDFALDRMRTGERVALVTLVKVEGSSPRPLGAQMAVSASSEWVGYLSGGCIERAILDEALDAIETGENRRVRYGHGSKYLDIRLPCGSAIELVIDVNIKESDLAAIESSLSRRQPTSMRIPTTSTDEYLGLSITRHYQPRRKLIIAGIGPATVQLARLGQLSGFETVVYTAGPDTQEASESAGITTIELRSTALVPDLQADARSAIALMFHDHEWEVDFIPAALESDAFYIGALGSRRTHHARLQMLSEKGVDPNRIGRIRGPAGLFSGAKSAQDIAVSILAEIMQIERAANFQCLSFENASSDAPDAYETLAIY